MLYRYVVLTAATSALECPLACGQDRHRSADRSSPRSVRSGPGTSVAGRSAGHIRGLPKLLASALPAITSRSFDSVVLIFRGISLEVGAHQRSHVQGSGISSSHSPYALAILFGAAAAIGRGVPLASTAVLHGFFTDSRHAATWTARLVYGLGCLFAASAPPAAHGGPTSL